MISPENLYVMDLNALHEDIYRMGNATSPNFSEERLFVDCRVIDRDGIKVVVANGNGFSAFSYITEAMKRKGKNVWKIRKGSVLPQGVAVVKDLTNEGHYMLVPEVDMPFKKFLGLLEEFGYNPSIAVKLSPQEIMQ